MTPKEQLDLYMAAYKEAQENAAQAPLTPLVSPTPTGGDPVLASKVLAFLDNPVQGVWNLGKAGVSKAVEFNKHPGRLYWDNSTRWFTPLGEALIRQKSKEQGEAFKQGYQKMSGTMGAIGEGVSNIVKQVRSTPRVKVDTSGVSPLNKWEQGLVRHKPQPRIDRASEEAHSRAIAEMYNKKHPVAGK